MTDHTSHGPDKGRALPIILAADEAQPNLGRQILNGMTSTLFLLVAGIAVLIVVLWKAP